MPDSTGYRGLLRNRRFVLFEASSFTAEGMGDAVYAIALPWLAYELSGSLLLVGLVLFAEYGANALTFVVAPWVDRARNKRSVFLACYPFQALAAAVIGLGLVDHFLTPIMLVGLAAVISFLWDPVWLATKVAPPLLLPTDQLFRASGFEGLLRGGTRVSGFALGGALVILVSPAGGMFLFSILLLTAAALAALVSLPSAVETGPSRYWTEFREGWKQFSRKAERSLFQLGSSELVNGFFAAAPTLLITVIAAHELSGSPSAYAGLFAAWAIGGSFAALILGTLNPRGRVGVVLMVTAFAEGVAVWLAVLLAPSLLSGAIFWFIVGAAASAYLSAQYVFLMGAFPANLVGRVSGNLYVFTGVSSTVGALVLGFLAATWPPIALGTLVGLGFLAVGGMVLGLPKIRRMAF